MTHDILDELAVPPPPYRAWRATLAVAQKQEPKEPQSQNVPKEVPKNPEIQKPTWAESSAEIRSKTDPAVQELMDMKVPEALEDRKRAAIAEAKEVIRLQLEANAKMSEPEAEKEREPRRDDVRIFSGQESARIRDSIKKVTEAGGGITELPSGDIVYGTQKNEKGEIISTKGVIRAEKEKPQPVKEVSKTDSAEFYENLLKNEKDPDKRQKPQGIIDSYAPKQAAPARAPRRSPPFHEIDEPSAEDIEDAKREASERVARMNPAPVAQSAPSEPVVEPLPKSPKVIISARPGMDGSVISQFGPGAEPGENKDVKISKPATAPQAPSEAAPSLAKPKKKKEKAAIPARRSLAEDEFVAQQRKPNPGVPEERVPSSGPKAEVAAPAPDVVNLRARRDAAFGEFQKLSGNPNRDPQKYDQALKAFEEANSEWANGLQPKIQPEAGAEIGSQTIEASQSAPAATPEVGTYEKGKGTVIGLDAQGGPIYDKALNISKLRPSDREVRPDEVGRQAEGARVESTKPAASPEVTPPAPEVGSETVNEKPKEKAEAPAVEKPKAEMQPERPGFNTGRELVKSLWEGTGIGLKSETFWGRWMANLNDAAANYWLGPVLRGQARLDKYQDKAKDFEEKMKDSNFQFTRDWYRKRMVKAQQRATMAEMKLGVYKTKKEIYDSRRADYCRQVALKYETYTEPYEARIRGAQEIIKQKVALEDGLMRSHKEQLARIGELNLNAKTRFGGLVKDRESVRKIKAAEKILQGIVKELDRSQKARFKQQGEIARFTSRVAPWKARRKSILDFAITQPTP